MRITRFNLFFWGIVLFVISSSSSCNSTKPTLSFYYWKTVFQLSQQEHDLLNELHVERLYIRYFDVVDQGGSIEPVGIIQFKEKPTCEVVPVIYITNESLQRLDNMWMPMSLADSLMKLVTNISVGEGIALRLDRVYREGVF